jgi:hypothetical protein
MAARLTAPPVGPNVELLCRRREGVNNESTFGDVRP